MAAGSLFAGLMSGTSLDGVDAVLIDISDGGIRTIGAHYLPYPNDLRAEVLTLHKSGNNELHRVALLGNRLAALYAQAVANLLTQAGTASTSVCAIGCHGQTLRHRPELGYTLQINNPAMLAELTGTTIIADFRSRDVAAGGQGAPLVPAFHDAMFRSPDRHRIILNFGGIANITNLKPGEKTRGFDCGPANLLLDAWVQAHRGERYDEDGRWARSGQPLHSLLTRMLSHPFFALAPPKSCGREEFNLGWIQQLLENDDAPVDVQATLLALTAKCVGSAVARWCGEPDEVFLCGGGAYNSALVEAVRGELPRAKIDTTSTLGVLPELVEATAFAWLAHRTVNGLSGNLPAVTGAAGERILGAIYQA